MTTIFCFSSQTANDSSETSSGFSKFLACILYSDFDTFSEIKQTEILDGCQFIVRKVAHFSIYGLLGILTFIACYFSKIKISPIICLLYAVSDEVHQHFVKGRSCELRDIIIDFGGSLTGIIGMTIIFFIVSKIKQRKGRSK